MAGIMHKSHDMGLHTEQLSGRTQQRFFSASEEENYTYPWSFEVDFDNHEEFDAESMSSSEVNLKIRELMQQGVGSITVNNPKFGRGYSQSPETEFCRQSRLFWVWVDRRSKYTHQWPGRLVLCRKHDGWHRPH